MLNLHQENAKIPNLYQIPVNRTRTTGENAVMEMEDEEAWIIMTLWEMMVSLMKL